MTQYDLNLREYWWIFKKRKFVVIFIAILLGFFSTAFTILRAPEPIYVSVSKIKFEKETPVEGLIARTITWTNGDDILTQTSMIKSYAVLQEVAKELGLIPQKHDESKGRLNNHIIGIIENLQSKVDVTREGFTNILDIQVTDKNPVFAQRLANTIARTYKDMHANEQMKRTTEAIKYIADRLREVNIKLQESEDAYNRFSQDNQLISVDLQSENLLARTLDLEKTIRELQEDKTEFEDILDRLGQFIKDPSRSDLDFHSMKARNQYQSANETFIELMIRRDTLLKSYTSKHPEVEAINSQIIGNARKMISLLQIQVKDIERRESDLGKETVRLKEMTQVLMDKKLELDRLKRTVEMHKEMTKLLEQKNEEALIRRAEKPEEVTIVKPAMLPGEPINPPKTMTTGAIGVLIGLLLGLVAAFIVETFDTSLGAIEDVEETLGTQVLGVIPHVDAKDIREGLKEKFPDRIHDHALAEAGNLVSHFVPKSMMAESFRSLRTNIQFKDVEKKIKTIAIASTTLQEGKTMVAMNLAITMAQGGMKVLLVGCDLRKPMVAKRLGLERSPGLTDVLLGSYTWRDTVKGLTDLIMGKMTMEEIMMTPGMDNLHIITSGAIPPNPADLIGSTRMVEFIEEAKQAYDIVIFDSTPILSAADAAILGRKVDGVLLVYRVGNVSRGLLKRSTTQLEQVNCNIMGVVLNGMKPEISPDFQDYKHYTYYYSYGSSDGDEEAKGNLKGLSIFNKRIKGQGESRRGVDLDRKGYISQEIRRKKPNRMKLPLFFASLVVLAGGLLWQNGVVDPFEWIRPYIPVPPSSVERKSKPIKTTSANKKETANDGFLKKPVGKKRPNGTVMRTGPAPSVEKKAAPKKTVPSSPDMTSKKNGLKKPAEKKVPNVTVTRTGRATIIEKKAPPAKTASSNPNRTPKDPGLKKPVETKQTYKIVKRKVPVLNRRRLSEPIKTASSTTKKMPEDAVPEQREKNSKEDKRTASNSTGGINLQTSPFNKPPALTTMRDSSEITVSKAEQVSKTASATAPVMKAAPSTSVQNANKPETKPKPPIKKAPAYPYSLYIGSFKTLKRADKAVSIYTRKGLRPAYKVKVSLSNGVWYRVYMGYFESKEAAGRFRLDNDLTETEVKKTQYANLIGTYSSTATLEDRIRSLNEHGFSSYVIADEGGQYRLFVGAFQPEARAERQRQELESEGIPNKIVER